jgi:orotate phosphoribosyltransferase
MLFGPAYKGITLAASTAIALAKKVEVFLFPITAKKQKITVRVARLLAQN